MLDLPLCRISIPVSDLDNVHDGFRKNFNRYASNLNIKSSDLHCIEEMLFKWTEQCTKNQQEIENPISKGAWEEYYVTWKMPRYTVSAVLIFLN